MTNTGPLELPEPQKKESALKKKMNQLLAKIHEHADKPWYPILLGVVAFAYHFFLVLPVDSLFVTSCLLVPKRWIQLWLATTTGFTLGAVSFALLIHRYGWQVIDRLLPGMTDSHLWEHSEMWMQKYGAFAVGGLSIIPLTLHPLVALAGLQDMSLIVIAFSIFLGRFVKYGVLGAICAYLPQKLPVSKK